jgi:HK97 family phage prohead protease
MSEPEKRCWQPCEELRVVEEAGKPTRIRGLAVPYNSPSEDIGGFREVFRFGAFGESLASGELHADVEHDRRQILGRAKKGTLAFEETNRGLFAEITLPKTQLGADIAESVRNGNLDAMSIAFADAEDDIRRQNGQVIREVKKATLRAVTLTAWPAYRQTAGTVKLRTLDAFLDAEKRSEEAAKAEAEKLEAEKRQADALEENARLRQRLDLEESAL